MKKLYLVDVSSLFFRAFFAVRPLTSPSGLPTNAIYGFLSMLIKLLKDEKPEYLAFCYDRKDPSFRKEIFPEYKAHRTEMPEDLAPQIPYIKKLADLMGIPSYEVPQFEADDIIGTLTRIGREHGMEVYIVSGDKDFAQLLQPNVFLYDTMKGSKIDRNGAIEKWGVPPEQFIDYLALVGDTSDNIPGVAGIGPKGAQKLLTDYKTLEGIFENIDSIKGALQEKLKKDRENAFLSRKLSTIVQNCLEIKGENELLRKPFQRKELSDLLAELNFKTLEKNIWDLDASSTIESESAVAKKNSVGETETGSQIPAQEVLNGNSDDKESIQNSPRILTPQFDIKFSSAEVSAALEIFPDHSVVWFGQTPQGSYLASDSQLVQLQGDLKAIDITHKQWKWSGHDLKQIWHLWNISEPIPAWDSLLASYVVKAGESNGFSKLIERYLGLVPPELMSLEEHYQYSLSLKEALEKQIEMHQAQSVLNGLDMPVTSILFSMEKKGILLDPKVLKAQSESLAMDLNHLEKKIHELAGEEFNIGSPKQLARILFEKLGLPPSKKTKTGFSTDTDVLEKLLKIHPIAELLVQYREFSKLKSTYVDALPLLAHADGRIHSTFNQALTTTGRLSSVDPNLQNIPIRTERGARIRAAFVASPGKSLISVDYSQIELRILAHICEDQNLITAFNNELDIHSATASEVFSVKVTEVTPEQRRIAKAVNFGIAYGQGAFGLAETLHISRSEASEIIKRYFSRFPRVQNYIEDTIQLAKTRGFVETLFGRRRYIDELKSKNVAIQKFGERAAINAPIQGTAADLVKKAMIDVNGKTSADLLLQVHDELIFEVDSAAAPEECKKITKIMESVAVYKVPLKANSEIGSNWGF